METSNKCWGLQVIAYGQTGAGKTYTMGTALAAKQMASPQEESVIPTALRLIFDALSVIKQEYNVTLKARRPTSNQFAGQSLASLLFQEVASQLSRVPLCQAQTALYFDS